MAVASRLYGRFKAEDLLAPGAPGKNAEIHDGELVEMSPADRYHNRIAYRLQKIFEQFCQQHEEFDFGGDQEGFLLRRSPDTLLSPDACLFRRRPAPEGAIWMEFAPEVAVEVLSRTNTKAEMIAKRRAFLDAGTEQFWLVDPQAKAIEVYFADGRMTRVEGSEYAAEGLTQGLLVNCAELFKEG